MHAVAYPEPFRALATVIESAGIGSWPSTFSSRFARIGLCPVLLTEHQGCPARRADRGAAVALGEPRAFLRHAVEVRRLDQLLSVATEVALREVVAQDEDDVRFTGLGGAY